MNGTKTIFQKEMKRVFKEPKMIFSLFILPVILMVGIYGLIGYMAKNMAADIESHQSIVYIQNMPESLKDYFTEFEAANHVSYISDGSGIDGIKDEIYNGNTDLLVVFPEGFMDSVGGYEAGAEIPDIKTFYNPSEEYSEKAREDFVNIVNGRVMEDFLAERLGNLDILNVFTVDAANSESAIVDNNKASGKMLSMMIPYLITMLLFAGVMGLGSDMIAGEKERGTMASLLLTPVSRMSIVMGKLLSLVALSILSALVYIVVLVVAMPGALTGISGSSMEISFSFSIGQAVMIAVIMLVLAFLYVSVVSVISVFSKSVKEASTYMSPIYILVIVAGLLTMMSTGNHETFEFFIPVYNSALAMGQIFTGELTMTNFLITVISTVVIGGILSRVIVSAFNSEKVMFNA